jgi:hypothetical protein
MLKLLQLSERSDVILDVSKGSVQRIHAFLDELNALLDMKFRAVKQKYYPGTWKLGLAYHEFKDNRTSYALYPVPYEKNDIQIKRINENIFEEFVRTGLEFVGHYMENPISVRPYEYAAEIVESKTLRVLKNMLLNHEASHFLASEFIFEIADKYSGQLELERKDVYTLEEIRRICHDYIKKITEGKFLVKEDFSPRTFAQFFRLLIRDEVKQLRRAYFPKDFSRLEKGGGLVWNLFSPEAVRENMKTFFANLPKSYEELAFRNFPEVASDLPVYGNASRVVVVFGVKDWYKSFQDCPTIKFFNLTEPTPQDLKIDLFEEGKDNGISDLLATNFGKKVELEGKEYSIVSMSHGVMDFIYEELPMLKYIYKLLEKNLESYFSKIKEEPLTVMTLL